MAKYITHKLNINDIEETLYSINFDNTHEMIDYIDEAPYVYPWNATGQLISHLEEASKDGRTGTKNFEEAINLFKKGDKEKFENLFNIKNEINNLMPYLSNNRSREYAPYGTRPNVPRALTQSPNCMYKLTREEIHKVINIYYNVSVFQAVSHEAIERRGMLTLALVDLLEKMDYRVNLVFFDLNKNDNEYLLVRLNIKDGLQSLDPNICFFPICHPAYNRRITPAVMEKCPVQNEDWRKNYGKPCTNINEIIKIFNATDRDICITQLGEEFGKNPLVKDIEIFLNNINFNRFLEEGKEMVYDSKEEKFIIKEIPYEEKIIKENITRETNNFDEEKAKGIFQKIKKRF